MLPQYRWAATATRAVLFAVSLVCLVIASQAALRVAQDDMRLATQYGATDSRTLETGTCRPRFAGTPALLEGLESEVREVRNRLGPVTCTPVRWPQRRRVA